MTDGKSLSVIIYISLTLVYEELDDTLQVISIETEYLYIITDNDLPSVILPLY
jgi:hypothetical protein